MSVPETTPTVRPSAPAPAGTPGNRTARRHGAASRQVGAAGQARRTASRDLDRRAASLRISRRVSGPAQGLSRPPFADVQAPPAPAPFNEPVVLPAPSAPAPRPAARQAPSAPAPVAPGPDLGPVAPGFEVPAFISAPTVRRVPRPAPRPAQRAAAPQQRPVARVATAPLRPMPVAAPAMAPRSRPIASAASALAAVPARLPISLPQRPRLTVLPAALVEQAPAGRRRVSTPAVMVAAITIVILTFGAILGLQISKTQVNEQMGSDLGSISALQQKVTATREQLNRESASANVDGAARKGGLFEPDLTDVTFTHAGRGTEGRAETAERAKRLLSTAPVAPTAAQREAADAKAKAAASDGTLTASQTPAGTASTAGQTPSATGESMASLPAANPQTQTQAPTPLTTGTGATQ